MTKFQLVCVDDCHSKEDWGKEFIEIRISEGDFSDLHHGFVEALQSLLMTKLPKEGTNHKAYFPKNFLSVQRYFCFDKRVSRGVSYFDHVVTSLGFLYSEELKVTDQNCWTEVFEMEKDIAYSQNCEGYEFELTLDKKVIE